MSGGLFQFLLPFHQGLCTHRMPTTPTNTQEPRMVMGQGQTTSLQQT